METVNLVDKNANNNVLPCMHQQKRGKPRKNPSPTNCHAVVHAIFDVVFRVDFNVGSFDFWAFQNLGDLGLSPRLTVHVHMQKNF